MWPLSSFVQFSLGSVFRDFDKIFCGTLLLSVIQYIEVKSTVTYKTNVVRSSSRMSLIRYKRTLITKSVQVEENRTFVDRKPNSIFSKQHPAWEHKRRILQHFILSQQTHISITNNASLLIWRSIVQLVWRQKKRGRNTKLRPDICVSLQFRPCPFSMARLEYVSYDVNKYYSLIITNISYVLFSLFGVFVTWLIFGTLFFHHSHWIVDYFP